MRFIVPQFIALMIILLMASSASAQAITARVAQRTPDVYVSIYARLDDPETVETREIDQATYEGLALPDAEEPKRPEGLPEAEWIWAGAQQEPRYDTTSGLLEPGGVDDSWPTLIRVRLTDGKGNDFQHYPKEIYTLNKHTITLTPDPPGLTIKDGTMDDKRPVKP